MLDQINSQRVFPNKKRKEITIECQILLVQISLGSRFQLQQDFDFTGKNRRKTILSVKNRKNEYHHWVRHIRISLSNKFQIKVTILSFWTKFIQNWLFPSSNKQTNTQTNENHNQILHIRISLCTAFQLKLTISIFWTKFAQKLYF